MGKNIFFIFSFILSPAPPAFPLFRYLNSNEKGKNGKRAQTKKNREWASARGMNWRTEEKKKKKKNCVCVYTLKRNRMKGFEAVDLSTFDSVACC